MSLIGFMISTSADIAPVRHITIRPSDSDARNIFTNSGKQGVIKKIRKIKYIEEEIEREGKRERYKEKEEKTERKREGERDQDRERGRS